MDNTPTLAEETASTSDNTRNQQIETIKNIMASDWSNYYQGLNALSPGYQVSGCLKLLHQADELLNQGRDLSESDDTERMMLGGISDRNVEKRFPFDCQVLGDSSGFASFKKILKADASGLAKLMRVIPSQGPIDGWHFMQFIDTYQQWFENNGFKQCQLFPATRLLAMKRPDQFVPISEASLPTFCEALGLKKFKKGEFQRYWDDIISAIHKTQWFQQFQPMDPAQTPLHRARVALLERLAVEPIDEAQLFIRETFVTISEPSQDTHLENPNNPESKANSTGDSDKIQFIKAEERPAKVKRPTQQPKKMTITQRKSAKVNQNAATKLMSQYYFANKARFSHLDMSKHRDSIIARLVEGESVEAIFEDFLP
ncbi:hypothetical protein [Aliikangiella sp. G2MR2-5]|uniref:hypothetical protein n=1 Tax=Aliikangiella sp. G2MR2-5 TaxID=2788943 RepID=UPI0018A92DDD|nr:hypothetical protein [Aliikangiella sp. G2MR2-5]